MFKFSEMGRVSEMDLAKRYLVTYLMKITNLKSLIIFESESF